MAPNVTDMKTWIKENQGRIFRILRYKKVFTPFEQQHAHYEDSEYEEEGHFRYGYIREAISIGANDWLLGFQPVFIEDGDILESIEYARLSDIRLSYSERDMRTFKEAKDPYAD